LGWRWGVGAVPDRALCAGPARLCAALGVTGALNGASLASGPLRIVRDPAVRRVRVTVSTRVGVTRAADWPLRFLVSGSRWVSRGP
jgi:DNA-3-methyladenine glycosylase